MIPEYVVNVDEVTTWLNEYDGPKFSFALSDPPYEMSHLGGWDNSGIAYSPDLYNGLLNVLHPGAFIAFYGYSRTHHRAMVAMEDAGFILHKAIFAWVYASGNPLGAANMQRRIDNIYAKNFGGYCKCDDPIIGKTDWAYIHPKFEQEAYKVHFCKWCGKPMRIVLDIVSWGESGGMKLLGGPGHGNNNKQIIAESMTPEADVFKDYTYGIAWSKPMLEPIILAQKPFGSGLQVENILEYGTGAINVHAARFTNRWPGNVIAVHDPECHFDRISGQWDCKCPVSDYVSEDADFYDKVPTFGYSEQDLALSAVDHMLYNSKPNKKERHGAGRNPHTSIKPIAVNRYLSELFLPPQQYAPRRALCLFSGSGSEPIGLLHGGWDHVTGVELSDEYAEISIERVKHFTYQDTTYLLYNKKDE